MKRSWFSILLVAALLGLLGLLATLQYHWLGQISDARAASVCRRLVQADTQRFAEDFNREIQNAYFNFQIPADVWREKNWNEFNQRFAFWREKTAYPNLIQDFYFAEASENRIFRVTTGKKARSRRLEWSEELNNLKPKLTDEKTSSRSTRKSRAFDARARREKKTLRRIFIRTRQDAAGSAGPRAGGEIRRFDYQAGRRTSSKINFCPISSKNIFRKSDSAELSSSAVKSRKSNVFQTARINSKDASAEAFRPFVGQFSVFRQSRSAFKDRGREQKHDGF